MALTKITSDGITDGTITSADINASAAIAGTKISPDFGSQNIVTTGSVGIGIGSQTPSTPQKQLHIAHDSSPRIMLSNDTTGHATPNGTELLLDSNGNFEILQRENLNLEFFTNGSQRMTINGSGNVGIGTISPTAALSVKGADTSTGSGGTAALELRQGDANNEFVNLAFQTGSAGPLAVISAIADATGVYPNTTGQLTFNTQVGGGVFERMRIDSSGKVGINETSPLARLHIKNGESNAAGYTHDTVVVEDSDHTFITLLSGTAASGGINFGDAGDPQRGVIQYQHNGDHMRFVTASAERMRIDSSGRLLIGTTTKGISNGDDLTIATSGHTGLTIRSGTSSQGNIFFSDGTSGTDEYKGYLQYEHTTNALLFGTDATERMRIDAGGGLQLGTSTATASKLTIYGSDAASIFQGSNTGTGAGNGFITGNNGDVNAFVWNYENGFMQFATNNTERMRIDSNGQLLIGTTQSSAYGNRQLAVGDASDSSAFVEIRTSSTGVGHLLFSRTAGANSGNYQGYIAYNQSSDAMSFHTGGGNQRAKIASDGVTDFSSTSHVINATTSQAAGGSSHYCYRGHHSSGTISFNVWSNGDVQNTNNSYSSISDVKLKENIVDANSQWSDIKALKIRNYNFKAETKHETHTQIGVVAQELETVCPKLVTEIPDIDSDGKDLGTTTKSVNYSVLYMKSIKALQEAIAKIETLETKVAALEAK